MSTAASPFTVAAVVGGEETSAAFIDGNTAAVKVRAMPIRRLAEVLAVADHESALIELVTETDGKPVPKEWADQLTDESHLHLLDTARRLNFSRAIAWGDRQIAAGKDLLPLLGRVSRLRTLPPTPSSPASPPPISPS